MAETQLASMRIGSVDIEESTNDSGGQSGGQNAILTILDKQEDLILGDVAISDTSNDSHYEDLKGEEKYKFHTLAENKINLLSERNKVILPVEDGFFREFVITHTYLNRMSKSLEITCLPTYTDIAKSKSIAPVSWIGQTVNTAMDRVLKGNGKVEEDTGWVRGTTEGLSIRTVTFDEHINPFKALKEIAVLFDLELRFRIEVDGIFIKRVVDMVKKRGENRASEFEVGKDITGIVREMAAGDIVTAMLGLGPVQEDGTRLTVEVFDKDALERWGIIRDGEKQHLWGTHEVQTEDGNMTVARLRQLTEAQLQKQIDSIIKYVVDAVSIEYVFGYSHEKVRLGDMKPAKDTSFSPHLFMDSRIIAVERKPSNPAEKTFILGDFIEHDEKDIYADFRALQKRFRETFKKVEDDLHDYIDENAEKRIPVQDDSPDHTVHKKWIDTSTVPNVLKTWDGNDWIKASPTNAGDIGAETPSGAKDKADAAQRAAIDAAAIDSTFKSNQAKTEAIKSAETYTTDFAQRKFADGEQAPTVNLSVGDIWIDERQSKKVMKRWTGTTWELMASVNLEDFVGKIISTQITENSITTDHIAVAGLDAGVIMTGYLSFDRARGGTLLLGGLNNGNGLFEVRNELDQLIFRANKDGIVDSKGRQILGREGLLTVLTFESAGSEDGWTPTAYFGDYLAKGFGKVASITFNIPQNFKVTSAILRVRSQPVLLSGSFTPAKNGYKHPRIMHLYHAQKPWDNYYDLVLSTDVSFGTVYRAGSSTLISAPIWGGNWDPWAAASMNQVQEKGGIITDYVASGNNTFYIESLSVLKGEDNLGLLKLAVEVRGYDTSI